MEKMVRATETYCIHPDYANRTKCSIYNTRNTKNITEQDLRITTSPPTLISYHDKFTSFGYNK